MNSISEKRINNLNITLFNFEKNLDVKVSIIVPVFNVEKYLDECILSALNQELEQIEIICVDDGSTDASFDILKKYALTDNRVKIIKKQNSGYGHTINLGVDFAKGEYICILESDDYIKPNMLSELYVVAKENDVDFVKGDFYRFVDSEGSRRFFYQKLSNKDIYNKIINIESEKELCLFSNTWSGIYKKQFLVDYNIRHRESPGASFQDNGFWFLTTSCAKRIMYVDKPYYCNRRDNMMSSVYQKDKAYYINEEYEFIKNRLSELKIDDRDYLTWLFQKKYDAYIFNYRRLDTTLKSEYINSISQEFKDDLYKCNYIDCRLSTQKKEELKRIISDPYGFYMDTKDDCNYSYIKQDDENSIKIVFICDKGYVIPTAVAIRSLLRFKNSDSIYDITVISKNLDDSDFRYLSLYKPGTSISFICCDNEDNYTEMDKTKYGVSKTALTKFRLPSLLPAFSKVLYIDGDVYIKRDLSVLYNYDIQDMYAGVVRDIPQVLYDNQIFGREFGDEYFNSGVMLLNLDKMREENIEKTLIEKKKESKSSLMDQDIFNEVFDGRILQLPIKYNTLYVNLIRSKGKYSVEKINKLYGTKYSCVDDIRRDSSIIHYCSSDKPWKYYDVPMADEWLFIYSLFNDDDSRIKRESFGCVIDDDVVNSNMVVDIPRNKTAVVFYVKNNNIGEIIENIKTLRAEKDNYVDIYALYSDEYIFDKSVFDVCLGVIFVNIQRIINRDNEYLKPKQILCQNYYRILLAELFYEYRYIISIDDCYIRKSTKCNSLIKLIDADVASAWIRTESKKTFWESPFVIINTKSFVEEGVKHKFWDAFNKTSRPGKSIWQALSKKSRNINMYYVLDDTFSSLHKSSDDVSRVLCNLDKSFKSINSDYSNQMKELIKQNERLNREIIRKNDEIRRLEYELVATRTSLSCRIGLLITALPRKIFRRKK